jgi:hypothetical protein
MRAIGATAPAVLRVVGAEAIVMAAASCVVAALPAVLFTLEMDAAVGRPFGVSVPLQVWVPGALGWVVLAVGGSALAPLGAGVTHRQAGGSRRPHLPVRRRTGGGPGSSSRAAHASSPAGARAPGAVGRGAS